jgi:FkbM family methyltransferase
VAEAHATGMKPMGGLLAKARKTALLLTQPAWTWAAAHGVAATVEHRELTRYVRPTTVIDIGANKGQFTVFALGAWAGCRVIGFEPLLGPITRARMVTARHGDRVRLHRAAIGPWRGEIEIRLTNRQDSSSILPVTDTASEAFGVKATGGVERAPVGPLEAYVLADELTPHTLLKLDVQGYELEALRGCASLLTAIAAVYVELSFIRLYEGQAFAHEVLTFLQRAGFSRAAEMNVVSHPRLGKVQSDCLFTRAAL